MQTQQYVICWPSEIDSYTFASRTSIVSEFQLEKELDSPTGQKTRGGFMYALYDLLFLTYFDWFNPSVKN